MKIGPVTLTRDSALLWLGVLAGVIAYLRGLPDPVPWHWQAAQWLSAAGYAVTGLMLKLQVSSLPSSGEVARGYRDTGEPINR